MEPVGHKWYFSNMSAENTIPAFGLYGERDPFPDVIHFEDFSARAPVHGWRILPHRHSQMSQLFLVDSGWIDATTDGEERHITPDHFLYIPEHCVHDFVFRPGTSGGIFSFPISVVGSVAPDTHSILSALSKPLTGPLCPRLRQMTDLLRDMTLDATPFRAQQVVGLAHSVLAKLAEAHQPLPEGASGRKSARLFELNDLITRHVADGWTASAYADALSISTGHLSRLCRHATGLGATAYIEEKVMQEACRLLAFTQLPISEVGYRLGFLDPSYFSKRFRNAQGQTPSDYRAMFTN